MAEATGLRNNALPYPIYGAPFGVVFPMLDADGDLVTGATTPDAEISKNGDTFADCSNESTEIATSSGMYYLLLTGTELTCDVAAIIAKSATAGMKTTPIVLYPRKLVTVRSGTSASGGVSTSTIVLDASASPIDDFYNGMVVIATIDSNVEVRVISDYVGSTQTASVVPDWNVAPDNNDTFVIKLPEGAQMYPANVTHVAGTAQTAGDIIGDTNDIQARLPAALVSGRIDASVGAMASGVLTATAIAADAITAAKIADGAIDAATFASGAINAAAIAADAITAAKIADGAIDAATFAAGAINAAAIAADAIGASELAADAIAEIQSGLSTLTAAQVNAEVDTALADARLDELLVADSDIDGAAPPTVGSVFHELLSKTAGSFTFDQTTDSLEAVRDNMGTPQTGDSFARLGAPAGASVSADIAAIEAQTDDIGAAGAGLTAVPWNSSWDAEVQSEVQDAIETNHLDHLLAVTYDPASKPGAADALLNELVESDGGVARYTANALEQAPTGGSAPTAAAIADAVWDEATAGHTTAGTFGEQLKTDVDAILEDTGTTLQGEVDGIQADTEDIQSRLPAALVSGRIDASVGAVANDAITAASIAADAIGSSELAASAVTEIQSGLSTLTAAQVNAEVDTALADVGVTPTVTGRIDAAVSTRASQASVDTIDDFLDTEIAAIKAVTDQLSAAQAEPSAVPAANATPLEKIAWLAALARNKVTQTSTVQSLRNDADSGNIATAAVSDDGTTFTRGEWA